jgi:hypothetical protein
MPHPGLFLVVRACRLGARYNAVYLVSAAPAFVRVITSHTGFSSLLTL